MVRANVTRALAGAAMLAVDGGHARKHRRASRGASMTRPQRRRAAQAADRAAQDRRFVRSRQRLDRLRKRVRSGELEPVHPRDRYWYAVGELHAAVYGEPRFPLDPPTHGGGSYYARYRAMYEAGFKRSATP